MLRELILRLMKLKRELQADDNEIFYIGGSDILPPPLPAEEERKAILFSDLFVQLK